MKEIELSKWAVENKIDKETVELIRKVLDEKWIPIINGSKKHKKCHLCQRFHCSDCPVSKYTGTTHCNATPFKDWFDHKCSHEYNQHDATCPDCQKKAQTIIDFGEALYQKCII